MVNQETQDPRDQLAHPDHRDPPEPMDNLDLADPPAHRESVECAPNTAPWMEEFSSKMEPAVKLSNFWCESVNDLMLGFSLVFFCKYQT